MATDSQKDITDLLLAWSEGDSKALDKLIPLVYGELHRLAQYHMARESQGHLLQTTALVNEAYLHLIDQRRTQWRNRAQFFGISAQLMRRILVDIARGRQSQRRGGGAPHGSLDEALLVSCKPEADLVAVDEALATLATFDPRKSQIVELRFFGGLTFEETAELLQISTATVRRDWVTAKAWLYRELSRE